MDKRLGEKPVRIHASLMNPTIVTKANPVPDTLSFPDRGTYGIFVCKEGTTDKENSHKDNSWNLRASYLNNSWSYYYLDNLNTGALTSIGYTNITITARDDGKMADLYAYAPYISDAFKFGPTAIPFSLSDNDVNLFDLMYAEENRDQTKNKDLDPLSEEIDTLEATFTFHHAMAMLEFEFNVKHYNPSSLSTNSSKYKLDTIKIQKKDPTANTTAKLFKKGFFNAKTGLFNEAQCTPVDAISLACVSTEISPRSTAPEKPTIARMTIVPTQVEDDELQLVFILNGMESRPVDLKKEDLKERDGNYGFIGGYKYTFHFTLDNYLYLNGITISDEWPTEKQNLKEIEI